MLMALGAAILANSRPFEGLLASAPTAVLFVFRFVRGTAPSRRTLVTHVVVPAAIVALLTIAAMGYYNLRVTGDVFRMPYAVDPASNQQLIRYFQGRRVWLFDVGADDGLAGLRPYTQD